MLLEKMKIILRDINDVYGNKIFKIAKISFALTFLAAFRAKDLIIDGLYSSILGLFSILIVIEISFFGLFFSENIKNKEAKKLIINSEENISYYQKLIIQNFYSISLKITNIILIFILNIFNLKFPVYTWNINFLWICSEIKIGAYLLFYFLSIYTLIIMVDLIVSIYFYLWKE